MSRVDVYVDFDPAKVSAEMGAALNAGLDRAAIWSARETTRSYGTSGGGPFVRKVSKRTGKVYWVGPSSPIGGYPAVRSGQLSASTTFIPARNLVASFGASVNYARHVHRLRPFLDLTVQRNESRIETQFRRGFDSRYHAGGAS